MAVTAISPRFSITSKTKAEYNRIIPVDPGDLGFGSDVAGTPKQRPFAAVLGCSDARVPIELIFHEGPNDLFVIRVAGNGLGLEVLGSLKYAVDHLGGTLKLIVVLGHSGCGALTTAVDVFLNPGDYLTIAAKHSIRNILDRSLIVVQASANKLLSAFGPGVTRNPGYRQALIEASIVTNAALSAYSIQQEFISPRPTRIAGSLRRLRSRDPRGMGAAPRQHQRNWIGLSLRAISPDLPTLATQLFNRSELLHTSGTEIVINRVNAERHTAPASRASRLPVTRSYTEWATSGIGTKRT